MRRSVLIGASLAMLVFACSKTETPRTTEVTVRTLDVGAHRVEIRMPAHWGVDAREKMVTLKAEGTEPSEVLLVDYVAATPKGMRGQVMLARELWRAGSRPEAIRQLRAVPISSGIVPSVKAPSATASAWSRLLFPRGSMTVEEADGHFATIIAGLEAAEAPSLATVTDWAMPLFDGTRLTTPLRHSSGGNFEGEENDLQAGRHDARRRDVVSRAARTMNGREAIEFETRDNLTQKARRRMTFVMHADRLLAIASLPAQEGESFDVYEGVRDSLVFRN